MYSYFTLAGKGESLFRDRGSRFIGLAFPLENSDNVKELLRQVMKEYPAARHYCYAWRLGADGSLTRSSDDGEPAGSAGKPILGQFLSNNVTNALTVVVRYFGGTLLGVGGLINAYRTAAGEAISGAGIKEVFLMDHFTAAFDDADMGNVMRLLEQMGARVSGMDYTSQHQVSFSVKKALAAELREKFNELYRVQLKEAEV